MKETAIAKMALILRDEKEKAYKRGLATGLHIAERITRRWAENHKLIEPYSSEKLTEWSEADLNELRAKLADAADPAT